MPAPQVVIYRWLLVILAVWLNSSCGFQLRGALEISADISPVYLEQGSAFELAREIKLLLEKNSIALAADPSGATSQLMLLNESKSRRVLSVDSSGRASEYLLSYKVNISIKRRQTKEIMDSVSLSRSLVFDPDAVLAATNEAEILYRDMRKDAARLVLLKLQARSANQTTAGENKPADSTAVNKAGSATGHVTGGGQ